MLAQWVCGWVCGRVVAVWTVGHGCGLGGGCRGVGVSGGCRMLGALGARASRSIRVSGGSENDKQVNIYHMSFIKKMGPATDRGRNIELVKLGPKCTEV